MNDRELNQLRLQKKIINHEATVDEINYYKENFLDEFEKKIGKAVMEMTNQEYMQYMEMIKQNGNDKCYTAAERSALKCRNEGYSNLIEKYEETGEIDYD